MKPHIACAALCCLLLGSTSASGSLVFINEIYYDNVGGDTGEFVEIAGLAGTDLTGWRVLLYNGNGGGTYGTITLSGTIADQGSGFGTLAFFRPGIQNGVPDGLTLIDAGGSVLEFLSYEGTLTAANGMAVGDDEC